MVEHDLFDFLLLSLPDNDTHSHKYGPDAQVTSLVAADQQLERLMHAAGGPDPFLEDHAVIVCSDHSQSLVEDEIDLFRAFEGFGVLPPSGARETKDGSAEIAVCPNSRAAQVYVLDREKRRRTIPRVVRTLLALEGVDLVMHLTDHPDGEAAVRSERGELRFAPRGDLADLRGGTWSVDGDLDVLALAVRDGRVTSARYPDPLARVWSALRCRTAGEVLASARPGWEFLDWGRSHHIGGGSHGSLHENDSLGSLMWCGTGPDSPAAREQWTLRDIGPMVLDHFGLAV
jgi:Type I phosphodiesterase / nucleotide pyrophosphatase